MSRKKAGDIIPKIIETNDRKEAIEVLNEVLEALYLTNDYKELVGLEDDLKEYRTRYKEILNDYRSLVEPRKYSDVHKVRTDLNFLYSEIVDHLTFDVNRLKIFYEENKTVARAESMIALKHNEEFQEKIKATSTSALRDIVGEDSGYKEYVSLASISYGLYQDLRDTLNSIRLFTDSMSSEAKALYNIEQRDPK